MMTPMIPTKPRKKTAILSARKFLLENRIQRLPIDPFYIARQKGWGPVNCVSLAKQEGYKDPLSLLWGQDADILSVNGSYKIIYNPFIQSRERKRYTIAHEIGHIVLGHFRNDKLILSRGTLSDEEYDVIEKEADFFAAEMLMPIPVVKKMGLQKAEEIQEVFRVSKQAALNREKDLKWWGYLKIADELGPELLNRFENYITQHFRRRINQNKDGEK